MIGCNGLMITRRALGLTQCSIYFSLTCAIAHLASKHVYFSLQLSRQQCKLTMALPSTHTD